jgi:Peptidase M30
MARLNRVFVTGLVFSLGLAACGGGGGSSNSPGVAPDAGPAVLSPACSGADCAALDGSTYSGAGVGIWRYDNSSSQAVSIDVGIAGVRAGNAATLVFTNGMEGSSGPPSPGALASAPDALATAFEPVPSSASIGVPSEDDAHAQMQEKNRALAMIMARAPAAPRVSPDSAQSSILSAGSPLFSPATGTSRSWIDNVPAPPVSYTTTVQSVCASGGRNIVWWVDPTAVSSGKVSPAALLAMQNSYCDSGSGGLTRLTALLGQVWGPEPKDARLIPETIGGPRQDVNVVLLNTPATAEWAGYFFGGNNLLKSSLLAGSSSSNEALAIFINANQVMKDLNFATSTLLHESTHMVNFFQRPVLRGVVHDTWLEETSAMMTEDIVSPAVIPPPAGGYNKILNYRLPTYLAAGGGVSYINWPTLSSAEPFYGMGGGFGAFLNRRYGLSIYQGLVTSCIDGRAATATSPAQTSLTCLDQMIRAQGGSGFRDELSRFGATVFSQLPAAGVPAGFGYPSVRAGAYTLQAKDLSAVGLAAPKTPGAEFPATSHFYQRDGIPAGQSVYVRKGVVVPAGSSLMLVIK